MSILKRLLLPLAALGLLAAYLVFQWFPGGLSDKELAQYYGTPKPPPDGPLRVYHLGHSLVGHDMPVMLEQLAGAGHSHASQIGSYATLQSHWEPDIPVKGFEKANKHAAFQDPKEALQTGSFDALVLTERIGLSETIREAKTPEYVAKWAEMAWAANRDTDVYVYETWHYLTTKWGWLRRIDWDRLRHWQAGITDQAVKDTGRAIHIIPAGTVMATFVREVKSQGGVGGITRAEDLFRDHIHFNDHGAYLVALTHYAVLYRKSPVGLPFDLKKADGTPMQPLDPKAAALMQEVVWQVVSTYPRAGVSGG